MKYIISFRRLTTIIDAANEEDAKEQAKYRWGIPDVNVQFIQVKPAPAYGWYTVEGGTDMDGMA